MALAANSKSLYIPLVPVVGEKQTDETYKLSALDIKAINDNLYALAKKIQGGLTVADLTTAAVDFLTASTVNTINLYSVYGDIADLTVDRLLTADKVQRYADGDLSDINYIWIQGQHIKFMTGTTEGAEILHVDRNGEPLYWYDAAHTGMSTTVTAYPVIVYRYAELCKAEISFVIDAATGYYTPKIVLGAGDGIKESSAKAVIYKGQTGLDVSYFASNTAERRRMLLSDDGIYFDPPFLIFPDVYNAAAVAATEATALTGIDVTFGDVTKVTFDVQIDVTASAPMTLLVEARVGGGVQRHCTKYFGGAYKDTICFNGVFDSVSPGTKTVDIVITPSTGTASIAEKDYRMMLTIRAGSAAEAAPYPAIKIIDDIKIKPFKPVDSVAVAAQLPMPTTPNEIITIPTLGESVEITLT